MAASRPPLPRRRRSRRPAGLRAPSAQFVCRVAPSWGCTRRRIVRARHSRTFGIERRMWGGGSGELCVLFGPEQGEELATRGGTVRDERPACARAALPTLELCELVARQRAALRLRLHSVETRRVEPEDQALRPLGEGWVPELLLHLLGDRERLEGVDEPLRRSPPDGVGAPEDVAWP